MNFQREPAIPGDWYIDYITAWHDAHPGAWERGLLEAGSFFKDDVWCSSTLDWDRQWFEAHGLMLLPSKHKHVASDTGVCRSINREVGAVTLEALA